MNTRVLLVLEPTDHNSEYIARTTNSTLQPTPRLPHALASLWRLDLAPGYAGANINHHCVYLCSFGCWVFRHLVRSPSVDNGFDEDPQVLPRLPGLVSFEADAQPSRATIIKRHLKRELLLSVFGNKDRNAGHLILLGVGETVMGI